MAAVTVKLPAFWSTGALAWFAQAEAQFGLRDITADQTKYWHVVSALDAQTAMRAASVLQHPPAADKYRTLKTFLVDAFEPTDAERGERLLTITNLGDRKPSELMDFILALNGEAQHHFLLTTIFLRALPAVVRNALATSPQTDLRQLALEADKVLAGCCTERLVPMHAVTGATPEVQDIDAVNRRPSRRSTLCYYHRKFGQKAQQCRPPCEWRADPPGNYQAGPR